MVNINTHKYYRLLECEAIANCFAIVFNITLKQITCLKLAYISYFANVITWYIFNLHSMKLRSYIDDYKQCLFLQRLACMHLMQIIVKDRRWISK